MEQGCAVKPQAVLVETNWVVDVVAPAYLQNPQAISVKYLLVQWMIFL